jgi:multidrug efflux pump subunit AcrA (membrane-fusion protein)
MGSLTPEMSIAPKRLDLDLELRRIAFARALRHLAQRQLRDGLARARAFADAGFTAWTDDDDAEALRRITLVHRGGGAAPSSTLTGVAA